MSKSESEVLVSRFRSEQQTRILRDLDRENEVFSRYLEGGKLEFWFKNLLASAQGNAESPTSPDAVEISVDNG